MELPQFLQLDSVLSLIVAILFFFGMPVLCIISCIQAMLKGGWGWKFASGFFGLLTAGMFGGAIYFVSKGVVEEIAEKKDPKSYRTVDGLASLTGPGGWQRLRLDSSAATLQIGSMKQEEFLVVIAEPKSDFDRFFSCAEFAEAAARISAEEIDQAKVSTPAPLDVNGLEAYQIQIVGEVDGTQVDYLNTYVKGRNHFYQILAWTLPDRKESAFPKFKKAVSTFHELPSLASAGGN